MRLNWKLGRQFVWSVAIGIAIATPFHAALPGFAAPAKHTSAKQPRFARFADWCNHQNQLTAAERQTVALLLQQAGSSDCNQAEQILAKVPNLDLGGQQISDISPLASLPQLTALNLSFNQISDIRPLSHLHQLSFLLLAGNQIADVSPLAQLNQLTYVVLQKNQITTIDALAGLTTLNHLNLLDNPIARKACPVRPATICLFTDAGQAVYAKAEMQYQQGQFKTALETFQTALAIYEKDDHEIKIGDTRNRMGNTYANLSLYPQALSAYERALALRKKLGDLPGQGVSLTSSATAYERLGEYDKALETLDLALDNIAQQYQSNSIPLEGGVYELPKDEASLFVSRALVHNKLGQHAEALKDAQKALEKYNSLPDGYDGKRQGQSAVFDRLGVTFFLQGRDARALKSLAQALSIAREVSDRAGEGRTLNHLGEVYASQGEIEQALVAYEQALASHRATGNRAGEGVTLHNLGLTLLQRRKFSDAIATLQNAIQVWESLRPGLADENKISLFETQAATYRALQQALIERGKTEAALEIAERGRARAFVELLASRLGGKPGEQFQHPEPPSIDDIRRIAKQQKATLVEYSIVADRLYIWVVNPKGVVNLRIVDLKELGISLGAAAERSRQAAATGRLRGGNQTDEALSNFVRGLRQETQDKDRTQTRSPEAARRQSQRNLRKQNARLQQSYQTLIAPIADLLPDDPNDRIIFVPQGVLFLVPFAALQDEDGTYLIEQHTLLVAPSIQVLQLTHQLTTNRVQASENRNTGQTIPASSALIVGNPTMPKLVFQPGRPAERLSPLPGAEREAKTIADILGSQAVTGDAATEKTVVEQMAQVRLIHLATHGLLDEIAYLGLGMPGAIALAPNPDSNSSDSSNDGLLTANEILDLDLAADLVVLSACNTGRGKITGDGVIGLSRSFVSAGVPSVIVSLWPVPDEPTSALMIAFYQQLQRHPDKARALRQAILSTMQKYPFTGDWAAFTLIGEAE